jgi:hypothetical protein
MAKYFASTNQPFVSQVVPQDLGLQQGFFDDLQKNQDSYKLSINGLQKDTNALVNDIPGAMEAKQQVEARLEALKNINYNDPKQQQAAQKEIMNIRGQFSPFGQLGARDEKLKKYNAQVQEIEKDKNDFKKAYRLQQLKQANLSPEAAIKFDPYGKPLNTEIITPPDFEYKDKNKVFSDLLKDVTADVKSVNSGLTEEKAHEALLSYMNGNIEERTGAKIYNSIKERALADPNLINSIKAEGAYFKQDPDQLLESALQGVANSGKYKKSNIDVKYHEDSLAVARAKKADTIKDANVTTSTQSEALPGSLVAIPKEIKDLEFTESGDLKPIMMGGTNYSTSNSLYNDAGIPAKTNRQIDEVAMQNTNQLIKNLQNENPELQGLKPKQVIEAYKNSVKALESESIPLQSISNVASKNIGEGLVRNKAQRNFYLFDGKGKTSDGQLTTVLDQLDIKEEDFNKVLEKGVSGYTQAGPSAGGYYVEVPDSKGNSRRIIISPDAEVGKIFRPSQMINEARKSLKPTEVTPFEDIPNYSILIKPRISKQGNPNWEYVEVIKDQNGNVVQQNKTTLDDIREVERNKLAKSNLLGSQLDVMKPHTTE